LEKIRGSTSFTDTHDTIQGLAGNVTWLNEYEPRGEDPVAEVMLRQCHSMGLCCSIVGDYAMYRAGNLASRRDSLALYIARPQTWSSEIAELLQEQPTPTFALGGVEFELVPQWIVPGRVVNYHITYGREEIILTVVFIRSGLRYGPRSNRNLTYYAAPRYIFSLTLQVCTCDVSGGRDRIEKHTYTYKLYLWVIIE